MSRAIPNPALLHPLNTLREQFGDEVANRLHDAYPGVRLYIPESLPAGHELERLIGLDAARTLASYCGGLSYDMPNNRARRAAALFNEGKSPKEIAQALSITDRGVRRILRKLGLRHADRNRR